jgi:hypothetical protein
MDWTSLIGPALGAAGAYYGAQQGGPQTTSQTSQMNPAMQGQWNGYQQFANQAAAIPYSPYQGSQVADFTQDQYGAMDQIRQNSMGGAEQQAGSQALQGVLNATPGSNPYLDGMISRTNNDVQNRMGSAAFSSGSFGNSGVAQATASGLADSANTLRFGAYEADMGRKMQGIGQALGYQNQNMQNSNALLQSGAMQQNQGQRYLDDARSRYDEMLNYPKQQLGYLGAPLGFNGGMTNSITQPGNRAASALGGGLLGLQLGGAVANQWASPPQGQNSAAYYGGGAPF